MIPQFTYPADRLAIITRLSRAQEADAAAQQVVQEIIAAIRLEGDAAVLRYTARFDSVILTPETMRVTQEEIDQAYAQTDPALLDTLRRSAANIRAFHEKQLERSWMDVQPGRTVGQMVRPLARVGVYVPGGRAAYPSSVLMNVLPAQVAGVPEIIMVTPPDRDGNVYPLTLVAAREAGCTAVYKVGGAQAVAALAFGTATIPRVDKITGPGNVYVAQAKRAVFGYVGIDMVAGPSEVLVVADATANPAWVAADMLSQAEHDPLAAAVLVTDSAPLAQAVCQELETQTAQLSRSAIAAESLENYGTVVVTNTLQDACALANQIAPEHLELAVAEPFAWLPFIENAGAVFLGHWTPEPVGDYYAGPNHVLPTGGTARFSSPLGVYDFQKRTSLLYYQKEGLQAAAMDVRTFAQAEGLTAHAAAVAQRMGETK